MGTPNGIRKGIQRPPEENVMAILDVIGVKEPEDIKDDKLSFLEAVRAISIIPETAEVPTRKMYEAVFDILRESKSLELIFSSYQLLNDLEKRFPRVTISKVALTSTDDLQSQLVVNSEVWSPFRFSSDSDFTEMDGVSAADDPIDCLKILSLMRDIATELFEGDSKTLGGATETEGRSQRHFKNVVAKILMFQYLNSLLERDFLLRCQVFKTNRQWQVIRDSILNQLLGSQRMNFKNLVKYSLDIMAAKAKQYSDDNNNSMEPCTDSIHQKPLQKFDSTFSLAESKFRDTVCLSVQTLLILIMELDMVKKEAVMNGRVSRSDGSRTPVLDIVIDQLTYNKEIISPFLQAITEPKWKMNIVSMYFLKYCGRSITRVLGSNIQPPNLDDIFKCVSNVKHASSITKKIGEDVIQLLLAHGFQAYLSLHQNGGYHSYVSNCNCKEEKSSLKGTCESFIKAFKNLQSSCSDLELIAEGKEALFIAATIISCA